MYLKLNTLKSAEVWTSSQFCVFLGKAGLKNVAHDETRFRYPTEHAESMKIPSCEIVPLETLEFWIFFGFICGSKEFSSAGMNKIVPMVGCSILILFLGLLRGPIKKPLRGLIDMSKGRVVAL